MYEPRPDPEGHPVVQILKTLADPQAPLPGWPEMVEHTELIQQHEVPDPEALRVYPTLVKATLEKARAAAAMHPQICWRQARDLLRQAETKAATAYRQAAAFPDQDCQFLQEDWQSAQRSLHYAQNQIDRLLQASPQDRNPTREPMPAALVQALTLIDGLSPFDQATLARAMVQKIIDQTPDLPENIGSEFHAATTNLMFDAAHPGEDHD